MKTILRNLSFLTLFVIVSGCATVKPESDKLIVRAEQTRAAAFATFHEFVTFEHTNRDKLWSVSKEFKHTADYVRAYGKGSIQELTWAIDTYKHMRTSENGNTLNSKLALTTTLLTRVTATFFESKATLEVKTNN